MYRAGSNLCRGRNRCDEAYYNNAEPIAEHLLAFIKANKAGIRR